MRAFEQIALTTLDIDARIRHLGTLHTFDGKPPKHSEWVHDCVQATHIYVHPDYMRGQIGGEFSVRLAFNYDLIPGKELELIQLISGKTVQLVPGLMHDGLSHLGYHIPDSAWLFAELDWWAALGYPCAQVSVTTQHTGTAKRYLYAFVDTRAHLGAYTKVISRMPVETRGLISLVEEYSHVNAARR